MRHNVDTSVIDWSQPLRADDLTYLRTPPAAHQGVGSLIVLVIEHAEFVSQPTSRYDVLPFVCLCGKSFPDQDDLQVSEHNQNRISRCRSMC
jgi:hypothetical protein